MAQTSFIFPVLMLILGVCLSLPLTRDDIDPQNAEAGDDLLRVKKSPDLDDTPPSFTGALADQDDEISGKTRKRSSVVLDLKESTGNSDNKPNPEASQVTADRPPVPEPKPVDREPEPPKDVRDNQPESKQVERMDEEQTRGDVIFPPVQKSQPDSIAVSSDRILHPFKSRSGRRKVAPSAIDQDYLEPIDEAPEDTAIIAIGISPNFDTEAEGSQAFPRSPFLQMMGNIQRGPLMRPASMSFPPGNNMPMDGIMLRQILQQQSEIKEVLVHIADHQATLQDTLYRIETHLMN